MAKATATAAFYVYISSTWTLLDDVEPINYSYGISDNNPTSRLADVGEMTLMLNNVTGQYTPGGPSALAGWKKGLPFKMVVTFNGNTYVRFRGNISDISIGPVIKDKKVSITVLDWLDYASRHPIVNPGVLADKHGNTVINTILAEVEVQPQLKDLDIGVEVFPTSFDTVTSHTTAYAEFAKVALSELGYIYLKKDGTTGETLVFDEFGTRHGWKTADAIPLVKTSSDKLLKEDGDYLLLETGDKIILNQTAATTFDGNIITDYEAVYGEHIINRMSTFANPRKLGTPGEILFTLSAPMVIGSGETKIIKGNYSNPSGGNPCNGQDMIDPVVNTDYKVWTNKAGSGTDITADLVVVTDYGTEGFSHSVTNGNTKVGYITTFKCRGTGIYIDNPIEHVADDDTSIADYGTERESLNQKYKNDLYAGSVFAESVVGEFKQPRTVLNSISFCANKSDTCMMAYLYTDPGKLYYMSIPELGITGNYYVQGIEVNMSNGVIMVKWIVVAALSLLSGCGLSPVAVEFAGGAATDGINFGYLPKVADLSQLTYSAWINNDDTLGGHHTIMGVFSDSASDYLETGAVTAQFVSKFTVASGVWVTDNEYVVGGGWNHIVVTYDITGGAEAANPIIYINGVSSPLTESVAPSGTKVEEIGVPLFVGNVKTSTIDWSYGFNGDIFDPRIYNRVLTQAEVTALYNAGVPDVSLVTNGLVFQGFNVRTGDTGDYIDQTLTSANKLRDNVYGAVGTPHGAPIGRAAP